jgi:hypothetical protein
MLSDLNNYLLFVCIVVVVQIVRKLAKRLKTFKWKTEKASLALNFEQPHCQEKKKKKKKENKKNKKKKKKENKKKH